MMKNSIKITRIGGTLRVYRNERFVGRVNWLRIPRGQKVIEAYDSGCAFEGTLGDFGRFDSVKAAVAAVVAGDADLEEYQRTRDNAALARQIEAECRFDLLRSGRYAA